MIKNLSRNLKKISCNHSKKPERKKSKQYVHCRSKKKNYDSFCQFGRIKDLKIRFL
ncbi:hypothetical protein LEP1GSC036_2750 [Leptospira weilii str. 2006001853]|uniref:Uncharacterized protein n=2 Tax=Leptospira weilii TaxID=28184 RepID=A0A828Z2F1_9LEPT|nr:hypothetical protein LEP1GSC036_2750 [Leptospira weilii str. 2006001853]EMJ66705.1 hypothetical protein LEP1GSC051_1684 [Leptospira sp. P2653]EMM73471.1 hypothetical protein LEP1GSC038_2906 [Leptospira weilii str. 2006001855]